MCDFFLILGTSDSFLPVVLDLFLRMNILIGDRQESPSPCVMEGEMSFIERRASIRHLLQIPVVFRTPQSTHATGSKTLDVSHSGLRLLSPRRLKLESTLLLVLRVPTEISGSIFGEFYCEGRVVHEGARTKDGFCYGVSIRQIEPFRGARHLVGNSYLARTDQHAREADRPIPAAIGSAMPLRLRVQTAPIRSNEFVLEQSGFPSHLEEP
jgi:hypothetical protein